MTRRGKQFRTEVSPSGRVVYLYKITCPLCGEVRETQNKKAGRCKPCAGRETYRKPVDRRSNSRNNGDGYVTKQGYRLIYHNGRYVPEHRLKFPNIPQSTVVHHIDGNKLNNEIDNLLPMGKREHREIHGQLERVAYFLIQKGVIVFDGDEYSVSKAAMDQLDISDSHINDGQSNSSGAVLSPRNLGRDK